MTALNNNNVLRVRKKPPKSTCYVLLKVQGKISKLGYTCIPLHSALMMRINSYVNWIEHVHSKKHIYYKICADNSRDFEVTGRTKMLKDGQSY